MVPLSNETSLEKEGVSNDKGFGYIVRWEQGTEIEFRGLATPRVDYAEDNMANDKL